MTPTSNIKIYVERLARIHGAANVETDGDRWAKSVTRLSGCDVELDPTENLIIALSRAGVISKEGVVRLQVYYLREKNA